MKKLNQNVLAILAVAVLGSCDQSETPTPVVELEAITVENLEAPGNVINRTTGEVEVENPFRYYSLETNSEVDDVDGNWDIGFKGTTILLNSGISGPGNAVGTVMQGIFEEVNEVPTTLNLKSDATYGLAIPSGSGNGWYNYNPTTHVISPIPGRILVLKTNAGNYAKVEILSYYKDNPPIAEVNVMTNPSGFYTFRYILQPDGSSSF